MITVVGLSPSIDITYLVDDFRLGEIHRPTAVVRCAGGKSLNMARAAGRDGADVALAGIFGGASGEWLARELAAEGVTVDAMRTDAESRTCVSVASGGALTEVYEHAPAITAPTWDALLDRLARLLAVRPGWLAVSGSTPLGLPASATADLVELGHRHGVSVAIDTSGDALGASIERRPALVKVNRVEAAAELGVAESDDLTGMAVALAARTGGGRVVLTDGAAGAVAVDGGVRAHARLDSVRGLYPVGSGDSFLGGLVAALDTGHDLPTALRRAMACGAANAMVPGAAAYDAADADRLAEQVVVETL